ncbi:MAG: SH3 beta-barrel fold-containing protein [Polynucleobacter sp.]
MAFHEDVRQVLEAAGSSLVSVYFIKKDGTERQLTGNLMDHNDIKGTGNPTQDPNIVRIRDIKLGQWRSFDCRRVIKIKSKGEVHNFA